MWDKSQDDQEQQDQEQSGTAEAETAATDETTEASSSTRTRRRSGVRVTLHWDARRPGRVAHLKTTLTVTEAQAKQLRKGQLRVVNDQLLAIEKERLGEAPDSRTWRSTEG